MDSECLLGPLVLRREPGQPTRPVCRDCYEMLRAQSSEPAGEVTSLESRLCAQMDDLEVAPIAYEEMARIARDGDHVIAKHHENYLQAHGMGQEDGLRMAIKILSRNTVGFEDGSRTNQYAKPSKRGTAAPLSEESVAGRVACAD